MTGTERPALSLAELDAYDPHPSVSGARRRYNCPLDPCRGKTVTRAHQSLSLDADSGAWQCFRCGATGKVTERWVDRPVRPPRELRRAAALRSIRIPPRREPGTAPSAALLPELLARCVPLPGTAGHRYLVGRGIGLGVATPAGVRYCPDVYGRPAVVFPLSDRQGQLVAINARYVDGRDDPKTRCVGDRSLGVFATPRALSDTSETALPVVEGPMDALSLAAGGVPTVAIITTVAPSWLAPAVAFRRVLVALDADPEGDKHAEELIREFAPFARSVERLRPPPCTLPNGKAGKDWADVWVSVDVDLRRWLEAAGPFR